MTLVTPTPPWSREKLLGRMDRWIRQTDFEARDYLWARSWDIYFFVGRGEGREGNACSRILINLGITVRQVSGRRAIVPRQIHFSN